MKFTHLRDDSGEMFATVAADETGYAVALCSDTDQFSRKTGRNIAASRLNCGYDVIPDSPREIRYKGERHFVSDIVRLFVSNAILKQISGPLTIKEC